MSPLTSVSASRNRQKPFLGWFLGHGEGAWHEPGEGQEHNPRKTTEPNTQHQRPTHNQTLLHKRSRDETTK